MKRIILAVVALVALGAMAIPAAAVNTVERVYGDTSPAENTPGWMFNRDPSTSTAFDFTLDEASIGLGSLYVAPIDNTPNADKFVGELFLLTPMADVASISWDFQMGPGASDAGDYQHFYMSVYAVFGSSSPTKFYDCRYNVIAPSGAIGSWTTVTFDPDSTYSVTTRAGGDPSPHACPASPRDMDTLSAGSSIRVIALNVGDTSGSDLGVEGYLDNVVVDLGADTTIYDFETVPPQFALQAKIGGGNVINQYLPDYVVDTWATKNVTVYLTCIAGDSPIDIFRADRAVTFKDGVWYYGTKPTDECVDDDGAAADPIVGYGQIMVDTKAPVCSVSPSTRYVPRNTIGAVVSFALSYSDATSGVVTPLAPASIVVSGGAVLNSTSGPDGTTFNVTMGSSTAGRVEASWTVTDNAGLSTVCKAVIRAS